LAALLALHLWAVPLALSEEKDWSVDLDATVNGKYIWRGISLVNDPVFQPSVGLSYKGLTAYVWANQELTNVNRDANDFTEVDYGLEYSWSMDKVNFLAGAVIYVFPNTHVTNTSELYVSVGYDTLLSPTLKVYRDVDEADGTYVSLGLGHAIEDVWKPSETASMSVELAASVGYGDAKHNRFYFGKKKPGGVDATASLSLPISLGENCTIAPSVNYSALLDHDNRSGHHKDRNVWAGLSLSFSF